MKTCGKCGIEKGLSEFYRRGKGYQSWCKECADKRHKDYYSKNQDKYANKRKKRRQEMRDWFIEIKGSLKCSKCEEDHISTLQFHHLDPTEKELSLSQMMSRGFSKEKILNEMDKCIVLCANCHFKEHFNGSEGNVDSRLNVAQVI